MCFRGRGYFPKGMTGCASGYPVKENYVRGLGKEAGIFCFADEKKTALLRTPQGQFSHYSE
jgi:hypothetical protein